MPLSLSGVGRLTGLRPQPSAMQSFAQCLSHLLIAVASFYVRRDVAIQLMH